MGDTQNSRRPREGGDPAAFVQTTLDSSPLSRGLKAAGMTILSIRASGALVTLNDSQWSLPSPHQRR
jgi:hypothetical protein